MSDESIENIARKLAAAVPEGLRSMREDLEETLVYEITRAMWNPRTRTLLDEGHAKGKQITPETALDGIAALGVPLHPGAEKFYKEAGLLE